MFTQLAALAALTSAANAVGGLIGTGIAAETKDPANFALNGVSPRPTQAPGAGGLELLRRQGTSASTYDTVLVAPDNICGYVNGSPGASFYCPASYNCVFFTAKAPLPGNVACCNADACNARIACLDFDQVSTSSLCNDACKIDAFTLKCTDTRLRFCNTLSFATSITDYWCNDVSISTVQPAFTTYSNQNGASRVFSPLVLDDSNTSGTLSALRTLSFTSTSPSHSQTGGNNNNNNNGGDDDSPKKKKSNTGAIAGGVVGGVAAVGLIAGGILLLLRKKKNNNTPVIANNVPPHNPQTPMQQSPGGFGAVTPGTQSVYDPNYQQLQQQQLQQQQGQVPYQPYQKQDYAGYYQQPPQQQQGLQTLAPDRNDSTSPMSDINRMSQAPPVPSPTMSQHSYQQGQPYPPQQGQPYPQQQPPFQPQQPTIHEAGGNSIDNHRGRMHELA